MNKPKEKNTVIWTEKNVLHVAGEMFLGSSVFMLLQMVTKVLLSVCCWHGKM